jgi:hypothetical protein
MHADARRAGVIEYLKLVDTEGETISWSVDNEPGTVGAPAVFGKSKARITPLYVYLEKLRYTPEWRTATRSALKTYCAARGTRRVNRQDFISDALEKLQEQTGAEGATPAQTLSRVLQELRDEGFLLFVNAGEYLLNDEPLDPTTEDLPDEVLDAALESGRLTFQDVDAGEVVVLTRQRRGQERLRKRCLALYGGECAFCGVSDSRLLVASHIARWSDAADARGKLANVICMCRMHDALFEIGAFSLDERLIPEIIITPEHLGGAAALVLAQTTGFRMPESHAPDLAYVRSHRQRVGGSMREADPTSAAQVT